MGRKSNIDVLLKAFIQRKNDKMVEPLTNGIIRKLQNHKDLNLQLCGDVIQGIRNYWYLKYESLNQQSAKDWNDQFNKLDKEIDRKLLFKTTLDELKIKYRPYYKIWDKIYLENLNLEININYDFKNYNIKLLWDKKLIDKKPSISQEELNFIRNYNEFKITRFSAYLILIYRYKDDIDFPIKVNLYELDRIKQSYNKFYAAYKNTPKKVRGLT